MAFLRRFLDPDVDRHLLADEGEYVIDEVAKHWVTVIAPVSALVCSMLVFAAMPFMGPWFWIALVIGLALIGYGLIGVHREFMDRFVITNMRVFRVNGILDQHLATMPMTRILDISVHQPFWGRLFGYGHLVFESAAQAQGLRDIKFVGKPEERDLTIQRTIQRAGLRASVKRNDPDDDDGN